MGTGITGMDGTGAAVAEIVAVGSELLTPGHIDTNSLYLTGRLNDAGWEVHRKTVVGDGLEDIAEAVRTALGRSRLVVLSGGLGPTEDDRTRAAVARALGRTTSRSGDVLDRLRRRFAERGFPMTPINERQAEVIDGAEVLDNPHGTAPGQWLEDGDRLLALLPGPPRELRQVFEDGVLPRLRRLAGGRRLAVRTLHVTGVSESELDARLAPVYTSYPGVGTTVLAGMRHISVKLSRWVDAGAGGDSVEGATPAAPDLDELSARIQAEMGDAIFSTAGETMEEVVGRLLRESGKTLAVAESCTSGLLGASITRVPGSSDYFRGGILCYSDEAKMRLCGVAPETLAAHGAVSAETARELARGVRTALGSDIGVSITGIAGPGGGTDAKPVGLVYIGIADGERTLSRHRVMPGDRESVRERSAYLALSWLRRFLL
ncbi:MAG: competence/damage-inducible protein A [Acidobacteriota bacterium]|jgi:nicotinamide-nucleotide amidase|nr:competence/damage-inducible protein A [Acidobacteriota bacterium]